MANTVEVDLPEQLTVANVQGLHEQFEHIIDDKGNDKIVINSQAVARADTAGVQLLYALVLASDERQIKISWNKPSETLLSAIDCLGLKEHLSVH